MTKTAGHIQLNDGWTVVTKGPSSRKNLPPHRPESADDETDEGKLQTRIDELIKRYERLQKSFRDTKYWSQLRNTLDAQADPRIESAVCLGLGSLSALDVSAGRQSVGSLWQLLLFQELTDYWQGRNPDMPIARYAQEPRATSFDKIFLGKLGVEILEPPKGVEKITNTTFLYDPFLPWAVMLIDVLPGKAPAFYLGSSMGGIIDMVDDPRGLTATTRRQSSNRSAEDIDHALEWAGVLLKRRTRLEVPADFEHDPHVFHGLLILAVDDEHTLSSTSPKDNQRTPPC